MEVIELTTAETLVLGLKGRLDAQSSENVKQDLLSRLTAARPRLVLDLSQLSYVSSAGLRVFLEVAKRVSASDGKLALCALVRNVVQVMELAGFTSFIQIFPTRQEAIDAVGK